jgi:hypothetical protein
VFYSTDKGSNLWFDNQMLVCKRTKDQGNAASSEARNPILPVKVG